MKNDLFSLIYQSNETRKLSVQELNKLVRNAQVFNKKKSITGILMYKEGSYIQYVEGKKLDIVMLYEKLLRDDRHQNIRLLKRESIQERRFSKWAMLLKFITADQIMEIEKDWKNGMSFRKNKKSKDLDMACKILYSLQYKN